MPETDWELAAATWQDILGGYPDVIVIAAVKRFIRESGSPWCPSASQICRLCAEIEDGEQERKFLAAQMEGEA
jgi:hypothetical protein